MWPLLVNFGNLLLGNFVRTVVLKFIVFSLIVLVFAALAAFVLNYLVNVDLFGLANLFGALPDGLLFFMTIFQVHVGLPLMIGGVLARFAIRRLPFIG